MKVSMKLQKFCHLGLKVALVGKARRRCKNNAPSVVVYFVVLVNIVIIAMIMCLVVLTLLI